MPDKFTHKILQTAGNKITA